MIKIKKRDICLIEYRNFPLFEFDEKKKRDIIWHPETHSSYWVKPKINAPKNVIKDIIVIFKDLKIKELLFFNGTNQPWISKNYKKKVFKDLTKTLGYFESNGIEKKFNGGILVDSESFTEFLLHFFHLTQRDSDFFYYHFTDVSHKFLFYLHYSGELQINVLAQD
ncbi:hypothetical protein ASG01_11420 [Chryseobacterium sp. Leaf180]|uniref:hypothetical protein n=1 Tax=Chryseobacterium sp. Leaf180 TaxID=1736289 RepID=UPI0006F896ED|nr:hypothetical protein [Chryseobacterium sp. Leaf180]KQR92519.1 hypothetical protein ASG01_11420 [Chryseobacterium sp. Leaf180]